MGLIFNLIWTSIEILVFLLVTVLMIIVYCKWTYKYWKDRKILSPWEPTLPFGHFPNPFINHVAPDQFYKSVYDKLKSQGLKSGVIFCGHKPVYIPIHPDCIKDIIQRNYNHFEDRGLYCNETTDFLMANLFSARGEKWQHLRAKLTPAFTPATMKQMFDNMLQCSNQMRDAIDNFCEKNETKLDIREMSSCYTIDVIGSCAFGIECNSFRDPNAEFRRYGENFLQLNSSIKTLKFMISQSLPTIYRWLGLRLVDKNITDFFVNLVRDTVQFRKTNKVFRKDLLQVLLKLVSNDLKGDANINETVTALVPHVFLFFMSGFHTSSTTLTLCLFELVNNLDIQDKLRKEIKTVIREHGGKINYDSVMEMKYMNLVIDETLRKYPSILILPRECTKDYKLSDHEMIIKKGTPVVVPIIGIQRDPEYYPEPDKFDPERFTEENKKKRLPFTYMPFGDGPKTCIGYRFALMQIKIGLAVLLNNYQFSLNENTKLNIDFESHLVLLIPKEIYLDVTKICE